jgi:SAM-dependent methyltransferase
LAATVGRPYFLLSSTSPLLQAWYARRFRSAMPYRLYALSNAGSMFALVSYPVLVEPLFTTRQQSWIWSLGFAAFVALCGAVTIRSGSGRAVEAATESGNAEPPGLRQYLVWLLLPACASVLLLAATNHLSQNVAAIPFLWVLPLSIYLLTFILCFRVRSRYRRKLYLPLLGVALGSMAVALGVDMGGSVPIQVMIPLFAMGLYACCMACHGELAQRKPHPRFLTHFYLTIAAGGALGGVLVGLVAPWLFNAYYELPLGLVGCGALVLAVSAGNWRRPQPLVAAALLLGLAAYLSVEVRTYARGSRVMMRNFYGGLRVRDSGPADQPGSRRILLHGTIDHGEQFLAKERRRWPMTYYGPNSGVGMAIRKKQQEGGVRVGVVGLGTGTLAAYGRPIDYFRFYEINPLVLAIAGRQFYYLSDSSARMDALLGDARLSLEREQPQHFDVLAVDAFSGDAIPVHLLTREAVALYFRHLKTGGILAMHISNRYLDLKPVLAAESQAAGLAARVVESPPDEARGNVAASWVLLASSEKDFGVEVARSSTALAPRGSEWLWTDEYSNLFRILR